MPLTPAHDPAPPDRTSPRQPPTAGASLSVPMGFLTALANAATLDDLFQAIAAQLPGIFPADRISIALRDSDTTLRVAAVQGSTIQYDTKPIPIAGTKIGECLSTRQAIVVNDADRPNQKYTRAQTPGQDKYRSTAILPLTVGDECLGTLNFGCLAPEAFDARTVDDLGEIATWIALQISRYQAVDRLKASEGRFDALINNAQSMIFAKTAEGRILMANNQYCELLGRSQPDIIGKTEAELFGPAQAAAWGEQDRNILATKSRAIFETVLPGPDGSDRTFLTQKFPVFDAALGEHIICAISTDISRQKQVERALTESEDRLQAFFTNSPDMMYIKDIKRRVVFANPAYLDFYGQSEQETLGKRTARAGSAAELAELRAIDTDVLENGTIRQYDFEWSDKNGGSHKLLITKFPIHNADGAVVAIGGVNTDVTKAHQQQAELRITRDEAEMAAQMFKEAADKAQIADRTKSDFLASMSHELRTPLNGTLGMATLLLDSGLNAQQTKMVDTIRASGQSLLMILNDILDLSKIEADELQPENRDFGLKSLMAGIEDMWRPQVVAKGLGWECLADDLIAPVLCSDSTRVRQIIFNLVSNALKFTDAGSIFISVTQASRSNGLVETAFEIADTGHGIPDGLEETLFQKFTQADTTITRRYGGTGLGLAICKSLVERMGGEIAYQSEPGKGTIFRFTVVCPPGSPDAVEDRTEAADIPDQAVAQSLRVLVAEDNAVNQQVIQLMLLQAGHRCDLVGNGLEAVAGVQAQPYDLVIMDIQMPEMDGISATQRIRALGGPYETLPIIALTANAMKGDREQYLAAGMDDYVAKPIEPAHLNAAIARQTAVAADVIRGPVPKNGAPDKPATPGLSDDLDTLFDDLDLPG